MPIQIRHHPITPEDALAAAEFRGSVASHKGAILGPEARPAFDLMRGATPAAPDVRVEPAEVCGIPGYWCHPRQAIPGARLLFLHGGGYVLGSARAMTAFAGQLATRTRAETFVAEYRLAPENPFPAAFEDALAAYRGITEGATVTALAGESAGGGLALALLSLLEQEHAAPRPRAVAVMSPWTDLTLSGVSHVSRRDADPIFTRDALAALAQKYLQGWRADDPRASPLFGVQPALPPIRLDVGEDEVLLDDALRYAELAGASGTEVSVSVWEGMPHVFQANLGRFAAAERSLDESGEFLARHLMRT